MEQMKRVLSAFVILPPLILFLFYASAEFFLVLVGGLILLSLHEYFVALSHHQPISCPHVTRIAACGLALTAYWGGGRWLSCTLFFAVLTLTIGVLLTVKEGSRQLPVFVYSAFGVVWIGWDLSHLVVLRGVPFGQQYILFLCLIVWAGDIVAMYAGKMLGRHKMAPTLSPGKTWEGACGGLLGSLIAAVWSAPFLLPHLSLAQSFMLGACIAPVAQISDLSESMLKRYAGVKDSGSLIPGHGGMLDRIDSLLFAAPMLVYMLVLLEQVSFF